MPSLRRSKIADRSKMATNYLIALSSTTNYIPDTTYTTGPLMTITNFSAAFPTTGTFSTGSLLQDLGRYIVVYDPTMPGSPHVAKFRQVMYMSGEDKEGQNPSNNTYVCVWQDYPSRGYGPITVARTG